MNQQRATETDQLAQLAEGMRRVANGHFDTTLEEQPDMPLEDVIHDFNQMTDSLLRVEALRESFVSDVAHEFKTPLAYIHGYAELLEDDDLSPERRRDYVGNIKRASQRLSSIINNLLEISTLGRPSSRLEARNYSLDEQLRHIMAVFMPQIERKSISYDIDLESVDIEANAVLLEEVWTNLLSNALKYTDSGGKLSLTLEKRGKQAIIQVVDTGCGMTKDQVDHAFDRFYKSSASHRDEGNGLGLAIVRTVVKKHNGTVNVKSELHRGTTVTVILPLKQP